MESECSNFCTTCCNNLNWIGVVIGTVLSFFLGAIWYSKKCFGNQWMKLTNQTEDDLKKSSSVIPMLVSFFYLLIMALFISFLQTITSSFFHFGLAVDVLALVILLGMLQGVLYEGKPLNLWFINAGYEALSIIIIAFSVYFI